MKKHIKIALVILFLLTIFFGIYYFFKYFKNDFLGGFFGGKNNELQGVIPVEKSPNEQKSTEQDLSFLEFSEKASGMKGLKKYLVIFQNSMELRPGGGFIGSFALVEVNNGHILEDKVYDSAVFDASIKDKEPAPYLIKRYLNSTDWGIRDSNTSPDFKINAERFLDFYKRTEEGKEQDIAGVIGVTTNILPFLLEKTGPVKVEGIEGEFTKENCLEKLEFEVEVGFMGRDLGVHERKVAIGDLMEILLPKLEKLNKLDQLALVNDARELLSKKDVQLYFLEQKMQSFAEKNNWAGRVGDLSHGDYLMVSDTNLGALKTDRCIKREYVYTIDFSSQEQPKALLEEFFKHTCFKSDFMTSNYHAFTKVFVSSGATLEKAEGFGKGYLDEIMQGRDDAVIEEELGKKTFGNLVYVKLGETNKYSFYYNLPKDLQRENYQLLFQKQAGMINPKLTVIIKDKNGEKKIFEGEIDRDKIIKEKND